MKYETRKYIENSICSLPCSVCPLHEKYGHCITFSELNNSELFEIGKRALDIYKKRYPLSKRIKILEKIYSIKVM